MANKVHLDTGAYVAARARGHSKAQAAREAGSRAKGSDGLSRAGARLEAREGVLAKIEEARKANAAETYDDWQASMKVLATIRDDPKASYLDRIRAINILAKVGGHYAPKKVEVTGLTAMDLLEKYEKGES